MKIIIMKKIYEKRIFNEHWEDPESTLGADAFDGQILELFAPPLLVYSNRTHLHPVRNFLICDHSCHTYRISTLLG